VPPVFAAFPTIIVMSFAGIPAGRMIARVETTPGAVATVLTLTVHRGIGWRPPD
jgi:hypothetical protein